MPGASDGVADHAIPVHALPLAHLLPDAAGVGPLDEDILMVPPALLEAPANTPHGAIWYYRALCSKRDDLEDLDRARMFTDASATFMVLAPLCAKKGSGVSYDATTMRYSGTEDQWKASMKRPPVSVRLFYHSDGVRCVAICCECALATATFIDDMKLHVATSIDAVSAAGASPAPTWQDSFAAREHLVSHMRGGAHAADVVVPAPCIHEFAAIQLLHDNARLELVTCEDMVVDGQADSVRAGVLEWKVRKSRGALIELKNRWMCYLPTAGIPAYVMPDAYGTMHCHSASCRGKPTTCPHATIISGAARDVEDAHALDTHLPAVEREAVLRQSCFRYPQDSADLRACGIFSAELGPGAHAVLDVVELIAAPPTKCACRRTTALLCTCRRQCVCGSSWGAKATVPAKYVRVFTRCKVYDSVPVHHLKCSNPACTHELEYGSTGMPYIIVGSQALHITLVYDAIFSLFDAGATYAASARRLEHMYRMDAREVNGPSRALVSHAAFWLLLRMQLSDFAESECAVCIHSPSIVVDGTCHNHLRDHAREARLEADRARRGSMIVDAAESGITLDILSLHTLSAKVAASILTGVKEWVKGPAGGTINAALADTFATSAGDAAVALLFVQAVSSYGSETVSNADIDAIMNELTSATTYAQRVTSQATLKRCLLHLPSKCPAHYADIIASLLARQPGLHCVLGYSRTRQLLGALSDVTAQNAPFYTTDSGILSKLGQLCYPLAAAIAHESAHVREVGVYVPWWVLLLLQKLRVACDKFDEATTAARARASTATSYFHEMDTREQPPDLREPVSIADDALAGSIFVSHLRKRFKLGHLLEDVKARAREKDQGSCTKSYTVYKRSTSCTLVFCCPHGICYGTQFMQGHESRVDIAHILLERWEELPRVIYYDAACLLHYSMLLRSPARMVDTRVLIDKWHATNHTFGCSPMYRASVGQQALALDEKENTQAAEQFNAQLKRFRASVRFMDGLHAVLLTRLFILYHNRNVRQRQGSATVT